MRFWIACVLACWAAALPVAAAEHPGLAPIEALQDPEKRARQALDFARDRLDPALQAYKAHDMEEGRRELAAIAEAAELALASLRATGRHPRRRPRPFKNAEIRTRKLLQQLRLAQRKALMDDFEDFDGPIERVEQVNRELLLGIMSPKN